MPAEKHPAFHEELLRCEGTLEYVEKTLENTREKKQKVDEYLDKVKRHFNAESSQDYIDLIINSTLQSSMDLKLRNLITARSKPYFARIDFHEEETRDTEKLYIGKMSLMKEEDQSMIIIDWRAPVANLYYEGRLGDAQYTSPGGDICGELLLKRQFSINGGILQEIFDIDITTNDEFLQAHLGASADNRLKEIVSTIQEEQNRIIRADMWTPLIVQGAAGSGKTTIALHRIAYLIYSYEKTFVPENFMIIAPNRLFLNYISDVLPELGVEKVKQTTFEDFAMEMIGKRFKLTDPFEKLILFAEGGEENLSANRMLKRASEMKSSMVYKRMLEDFVRGLEERYIPREDFKIGNMVIFKYEEINSLFRNDYRNWPMMDRIREIKKYLTNRLKQKKNLIINRLHDECDSRIFNLKMTMEDSEERQKLIIEAIDKKNGILDKLESHSKKAVNDYVKKLPKLTPYQCYREFLEEYLPGMEETRRQEYYQEFANSEYAMDGIDEEEDAFTLMETLYGYSARILKSGNLETEDLAPIMYIKYLIYGVDEKVPVRHIVIDEAQDFSVFQFHVLKQIVKDSSFTLLGDLCQGIHSYRGTRNWQHVLDHVFYERKGKLLTLEQSYRTTVEIMDGANAVMDHLKQEGVVKARPVIRHGDKVRIVKSRDMKEAAAGIARNIEQLRQGKFKSIAVICKTGDECNNMHDRLKGLVPDVSIISGKEDAYRGGTVIVPAYLAKGLEFDGVMVANVSRERYGENELDIKLLYVAMTRPLHKLYLYYWGEPSTLIEGVGGEAIEVGKE